MPTDPTDDPTDEMERLLRRLPQPELPAEWRAPLLRAARPPVWPWFTRPVQAGLAAAWACIGALHLSMPAAPDPLPMAHSGPSPLTFPRPLPSADWPADFDLAWARP